SAAEVALDLFRGGARVTLVYRGAALFPGIKYWVLPDLQNRIAAGEIQAHFQTDVSRIEPGHVVIRPAHGAARAGVDAERVLPADVVLAMTGYHPDFEFLKAQGIELDAKTQRPAINPDTLETNVPGLYVAGVIVGGQETNEIFIENGRFHGRQIAAAIR